MEITGRKFPHPNRIRKLRKLLSLKQEALRKKMGLNSRIIISHWENGKNQPDPQQISELMQILDCDFVDLFPDQIRRAKNKHSHHEKNKKSTKK